MRPRGDGLKLFITILLPFVVIFGVLELAIRFTSRGHLAFYRSVGATRYIRQAEALLDEASEIPA